MGMLFLSIWLLLGHCGSWLLWWDWVVTFEKPPYCPTPRAIAFATLGSVLGLAMFGAGLIITAIRLVDEMPPSDSWWTRPVCKRIPTASGSAGE